MYRNLAGLRVLAIAVLITVTGACSSDSGESSNGEPALGTPVGSDLRNFALPLDAYSAGPVIELLKAENVLVARCMAGFGFTGEYISIQGLDSGPASNERRYWLVDASNATSLGYHSPWADMAKEKSDANSEWSPVEAAVLTGRGSNMHEGREIPQGGCVGDARRKLAEGVPEIPKLDGAPVMEDGSGASVPAIAEHLAAESFDRMLNDSRVTKAVAEWSTCMQGKGFHYKTPQNANNDPRWSGDVASDEEIATATADVACKQETDLVSTMATVETAYQQRAVEENAEALAQVKEAMDTRIKNANAVLAGG